MHSIIQEALAGARVRRADRATETLGPLQSLAGSSFSSRVSRKVTLSIWLPELWERRARGSQRLRLYTFVVGATQ